MHRFRMNQNFQKFLNSQKFQGDHHVISDSGYDVIQNILSKNGYWFYAINDGSTIWESGSYQIIGHLQRKYQCTKFISW